jgi:hypothetical protein
MTPQERLRILGPDCVAEMRRQAAAALPPSRELVADLRRLFAPVVAELASPAPQDRRQAEHSHAA